MGGWEGGVGVGKKPKTGYTIHWNRNKVVVSSMKHRNSHSVHACHAKMVVGSSLIPRTALLVFPHPAVDRHEFTVSKKCCA